MIPLLTSASATKPLQMAVPTTPKTNLLLVSSVKIILAMVSQPYSVRSGALNTELAKVIICLRSSSETSGSRTR